VVKKQSYPSSRVASFFTSHGKVIPCPIRVKSTTTTEINIMAFRCGNALPSDKVAGSPIAMASETMPLMPDQLIIKLF
jgi:hypothetical protein